MNSTFALVTLAFTVAFASAAPGDEPESPPIAESQPVARVVVGQEHVVEFVDETRMHGRVLKLDADALVLQQSDSKEPLIFSVSEIQRITLRAPSTRVEQRTNATLQLAGCGWFCGDVSGFKDGKFQMRIGDATNVSVERAKVRWLYLSPSVAPDAYDGPGGTFGFDGWEGGEEWEPRDGGFHGRAATVALARKFVLTEKVDIEISASDINMHKWLATSCSLANADDAQGKRFSSSRAVVAMNSTSVSADLLETEKADGNKTMTADFKPRAGDPKITTYRFLHDRKTGSIIAFVNGRKIADWKSAWDRKIFPSCLFSLFPSEVDYPLVRLRIMPWDGNAEPDATREEAGKDLLTAGTPERHAGSIEAVTAGSVRFAGKEFSRKEPIFIRIAGNDGAQHEVQSATVARLHFAQRGEMDVTALDIRDGQIRLGTSFAGEIVLPLAAFRSIEFPRRKNAEVVATDRLVFSNGDILQGSFTGTGLFGAVKWRSVSGVDHEFSAATLAGTVLVKKSASTTLSGSAAVRFRNGDWLGGDVASLDATHLHFKVPQLGGLRIDRATLLNIYFEREGEVPVWDGVADRDLWMKAQSGQIGTAPVGKSIWRYLDGAFCTPAPGQNGYPDKSTANLGRTFATLPEKVEVCFDTTSSDGAPDVGLQLFSDPVRGGGISISSGGGTMAISEAGAMPGVAPREIEAEFEDTPDRGGSRSLRLLADRRTGQVAIFVNGKLVASTPPRAGKNAPKLGRGLFFMPQGLSLMISNLWLAPWVGRFPELPTKKKVEETPLSAPSPAAPQEMVALANGDETPGTVERITPDSIFLKCEIGTIELPVKRALMVDFAAKAVPPVSGMRLYFAGGGMLTVQSFALDGGKVSIRTAVLGDLTFPIEALSEIGFPRAGARTLAGIASALEQPRKPAPARALDSVKMDPSALDGTTRRYDLIEFTGNGGEEIIGRWVSKTAAAKDTVTFEDQMKLSGNSSINRNTVVEKNAALRLKKIVIETKDGTTRNKEQMTIAGGKATLSSGDVAGVEQEDGIAVPPNTSTISLLLRVVTLLPRDAGGAWMIDRLINEMNMDLGPGEPHRLECAGKQTVEHGDMVRVLTRFTLRTESQTKAEFFVDENGIVQWVDFEESNSPAGRAMKLHEGRE